MKGADIALLRSILLTGDHWTVFFLTPVSPGVCHCGSSFVSTCKSSSIYIWAVVAQYHPLFTHRSFIGVMFLQRTVHPVHIRADFNYPASVCSLSELHKGNRQLVDLKPTPPLSFWLNGARLADMNPSGCPRGQWEEAKRSWLPSLCSQRSAQKTQDISSSCSHPSNWPWTLCVGNAAISYIEEGLTWHLWPLLTSPSCASAAVTLLHPPHFENSCQVCENVYISKAFVTQRTLPALSLCHIQYRKNK